MVSLSNHDNLFEFRDSRCFGRSVPRGTMPPEFRRDVPCGTLHFVSNVPRGTLHPNLGSIVPRGTMPPGLYLSLEVFKFPAKYHQNGSGRKIVDRL